MTFRWRLGLDEYMGDMGWWVDDVKIYQCLPRDTIAPGVVTDLTVTPGPTEGIANLNWTAPDEDGPGPSGPVAAYFVKYSTSPFTSWEDGTLVTSGLPIPVAPGDPQTMTVSGLLAGEPYYFAVRAQDEQFNLGSYVTASGIAGFTRAESLGAPILLSPAQKGVTNDLTPRLDWKDHQPRAAYYGVQVATSNTFEPASLVQNELADESEFVVPSDLTSGSTYYWRVQAYDFDDQPAVWSAVRYFTIDTMPPLVPAASFPASGASVRGVPVFRWARVDGAVRYQFEIDDNGSFDSPLLSIIQRSTIRRLPGGVRGTYYWRVRAQDAVGNWSAWSPASIITILPPR
ncbi:MAG: fibronectin type III domain-containing protein [Anaerolineales bacterium]